MSNAPNRKITPEMLYNVMFRHILSNGYCPHYLEPGRIRWSRQYDAHGSQIQMSQTKDDNRYSHIFRDILAVLCRHSVGDRCAVALFMGEGGSQMYIVGSSASQNALNAFLNGLWQKLESLTNTPQSEEAVEGRALEVAEEDVVAYILKFILPRLEQACTKLHEHYLSDIEAFLTSQRVRDDVKRATFVAYVTDLRQLCTTVNSVPSNTMEIFGALKTLFVGPESQDLLWEWINDNVAAQSGLGT